jgi:hypothetical protein
MLSCVPMNSADLVASGAQPDIDPNGGVILVIYDHNDVTCF